MKEIEFSEMSVIGEFCNYIIAVFTNDSENIPHFHILRRSDKSVKFDSRLCLEKSEYIHHTDNKNILNSYELIELVKFLNDKDKWGEQNWIVLLKAWVRNNPSTSIDINTPMPDYVSNNTIKEKTETPERK